MKSLLTFLLFSVACISVLQAQDNTGKQALLSEPFVIGETLTMQSDILGEERPINIYLPQGYGEDSSFVYPVIYLLDGSAGEDFVHITGLVEFNSFPWITVMPKSIVVGIANVDRRRDFTYPSNNSQDNEELPTSGKSALFIDFIADELQPLIEQRYACSTEKMIVGQSLGGLLATEILYIRPELFDKYLIVSPSLWWDDESMLARDFKLPADKSVVIVVGAEGDVMERVARELHAKVKGVASESNQVHFEYLPEYSHGDVLHMAFYRAIQTFYGTAAE